MKEELTRIYNELLLIHVQGIDSVHMANAIIGIERLIQKDDEKEEKPKTK